MTKPKTFSLLLSILLIQNISFLLTPSDAAENGQLLRSYRNGPINLTENAEFYFQFEPSFNRIFLGLVIKDSSVVSSSENWLGIGIGEAFSGSMLGSDIVTAHFLADIHDTCKVVDRYVPYVANPTSSSPSVFPLPDECKESDWLLISCSRDVDQGVMVLEVRRPLTVDDDRQDRPIAAGLNSVLHSYGAGPFAYHGPKRHSTKIKLFSFNREESSYSLNGLPSDVTNHVEVRASSYELPSTLTTVACTATRIPLEVDEQAMIVAVEPIINDESTSMIRQIILMLCNDESYAGALSSTTVCESNPAGPLGNPEAGCSSFVYAYTRGLKGFQFPSNVGILIDNEKPFLVMETFYVNPNAAPLKFDTSGVRVHYTSKLRKFAVGSLFLGDPLISRSGQQVIDGHRYQHSCPKSCTSRFQRAINVFNSFSYMRGTGRSIRTNMFRPNGKFVQPVNEVNFWSEGFQRSRHFEPVLKIRNGDQLQTTCQFNTSKLPSTKFGLGRTSEACMEILLYWPIQTDRSTKGPIEICGFKTDPGQTTATSSDAGVTLCGSKDKMVPQPLAETNPVFDDTFNATSVFGLLSEQCPAPSVSVSPSTSTSASPSLSAGSEKAETSDPAMMTDDPADTSEPPSSAASPLAEDSGKVETDVEDGVEDKDDGVNSSGGGSGECFNAAATVQLRSGRIVRMDELQVGDEVLVEERKYSPVFMFTHADRHVRHRFVKISFGSSTSTPMPDSENNNKSIGRSVLMTPGHVVPLVHRNGYDTTWKHARDVVIGDRILDAFGNPVQVTDLTTMWDYGLFNPQTHSGNIVVDEILMTTFTEAVEPVLATALLAPLRWMFSISGIDSSPIFS